MFFSTAAGSQSFVNLLEALGVKRLPATLVLLGLLAGCATGDVAMLVPIAGGQKARVPLDRNGVRATEVEGFSIRPPTFALNADRTRLLYLFAFADGKQRALKNVRVEDVSDAKAVVLLDDPAPKLQANGTWQGESRPLPPGDEGLKWLYSIENTARVFRFTIVAADGHTVTVNQGGLFPNVVKSMARQAFGEKY